MEFSSTRKGSFLCVYICYFVLFLIIAFIFLKFASFFRNEIRVKVSLCQIYFIKVKIILSLKFKINLIFYLIKEFMKHSCLNFFYEIVNKISIKV